MNSRLYFLTLLSNNSKRSPLEGDNAGSTGHLRKGEKGSKRGHPLKGVSREKTPLPAKTFHFFLVPNHLPARLCLGMGSSLLLTYLAYKEAWRCHSLFKRKKVLLFSTEIVQPPSFTRWTGELEWWPLKSRVIVPDAERALNKIACKINTSGHQTDRVRRKQRAPHPGRLRLNDEICSDNW